MCVGISDMISSPHYAAISTSKRVGTGTRYRPYPGQCGKDGHVIGAVGAHSTGLTFTFALSKAATGVYSCCSDPTMRPLRRKK